MFYAGTAKTDITIFKKDVAMLGYGMYFNVVKDVETPLYARAFVFDDGIKKVAYVNVELCFSTLYLKKGVIERLQQLSPNSGWTDANVMITAQHTHSAPGGFTQHFFYNLVQPGFQQDVYEKYRDGITSAILQAEANRCPAHLKWAKGAFDENVDIAFNRSLKSYNRNKDVNPLSPEQKHLAVDRNMKFLLLEEEGGKTIGAINWFGVHTTSISNDNNKICSDNKGYAATYMENKLNQTDNPAGHHIVTAFAQDIAGDVSPNYVWDKKKKWTRGPFEDDFDSARYSGNLQFEKAVELMMQAAGSNAIEGKIDYMQTYINMADASCDPEFTNGHGVQKTSPASWGVAFLRGTKEGPGMPYFTGLLLSIAFPFVRFYEKNISALWVPKKEVDAAKHKYKSQAPKVIVLEGGTGRIMTAKYAQRIIVPGFVDPVVKYMKYLGKTNVTNQVPWVSSVLPAQIFIIGKLAIVGVPSEITTIAGKRMREMLEPILAKKGVEQVIISSYANCYAGYITTNEEYQQQAYEGGHTVFGQWTHAAYMTVFRKLANEMLDEKHPETSVNSATPEIWPSEKLWRGFEDESVRIKV